MPTSSAFHATKSWPDGLKLEKQAMQLALFSLSLSLSSFSLHGNTLGNHCPSLNAEGSAEILEARRLRPSFCSGVGLLPSASGACWLLQYLLIICRFMR
jgi:hypothetical protein